MNVRQSLIVAFAFVISVNTACSDGNGSGNGTPGSGGNAAGAGGNLGSGGNASPAGTGGTTSAPDAANDALPIDALPIDAITSDARADLSPDARPDLPIEARPDSPPEIRPDAQPDVPAGDCRTTGCPSGSHCDVCKGANGIFNVCIPNGAAC